MYNYSMNCSTLNYTMLRGYGIEGSKGRGAAQQQYMCSNCSNDEEFITRCISVVRRKLFAVHI
jgi:hypothetical protein